ncbi:hypothetical protein DIW83_10615 [Acinetobacter nosocomialis]|uniref:hypothetical protein n=1 Tax=Acinetobacter nosocomialis TaxID=106654 RepID=UPI0002D4A53D|nr:hypothetical protein [Acinetobacter nosocomialis]AWL19444.1 hypothetical protein DIW83_10615 [Acinetobacter nosocomialis]
MKLNEYVKALLFAFLITAVFYISCSFLKSNHNAYAIGFIFGLSFTLNFQKQAKSSKAALSLGKYVKEWTAREIRRVGLFAPHQDETNHKK